MVQPRTTVLYAFSSLLSRHSDPNHAGCPAVALSVASAPPAASGLRHERAGSPPLHAESGSSSYGLPVHLRLLPTPPHGDAVTFNYGAHDWLRHGLPPCKQSVLTERTRPGEGRDPWHHGYRLSPVRRGASNRTYLSVPSEPPWCVFSDFTVERPPYRAISQCKSLV